MADQPFVVRLLPSSGLDGAFRVHLSPESLEKLELKVGDLCQITGENGSAGYGIAWRATDKMGNSPKLRPAKMTDTLRTAYGFKEGSHVAIAKTTASIVHADKVTLSDVTPSDYGNDLENGRWRWNTGALLANSEAITPGTTFDVNAPKRLKKRFYVDYIEPPHNAQGSALFYCDDKTELVFSDGSQEVIDTPLLNGDSLPVLDASRIGGLVEQVKKLNERLDNALKRSRQSTRNGSQRSSSGWHTLLHGYEGTGKSLLLRRIEETAPCNVLRIKQESTVTKTQASIQSVFQEAVAKQPSIILIDNAEDVASSDNKICARTLCGELDSLSGAPVVVIAAARSATGVDGELTRAGRLRATIELPIPDVTARTDILNVLLDHPSSGSLATEISAKTHGFTGSDLACLVEAASERAETRQTEEHAEWVDVRARVSTMNGGALDGQVDGSVHSQATTEVGLGTPQGHLLTEVPETIVSHAQPPTKGDFELALQEVRPTALREVFLEKPKVRWSDIGGSQAAKERFDETLGWPLTHADKLAEWRMRPSKGVLLYGPPGCSKTMTAQAVATMYDLNFIAVKGAELISMYVGESERAIRELFRKARQAAPCIIFFDEIDSIGSKREGGGSTKGLNVLTTLLNEMDGFESMNNVLVLAATNRPEVLDPALLRPGRFDSHVYVGLPDNAARREILEICLRDLPVSLDVTSGFDALVADTEGFSGAEIVRVCDVAKTSAMRRRITRSQDGDIGADDFKAAFGLVRRGVTKEMLAGYEGFGNRGSL